jgi:hypothetical protein
MKCENCNKDHNGDYGSGRFCSQKCARSYSTKNNRKEISKKVSKTLTLKNKKHDEVHIEKNKIVKIKKCPNCGNYFKYKKKRKRFCNNSCAAKFRAKDPEYIKKLSIASKKRSESLQEKIRLKEIGRKGGFGQKGYTKLGTRYESKLEKKMF